MGLLNEESSFIVAVGFKLSKVASKNIWDYNAPTIPTIMASYTKNDSIIWKTKTYLVFLRVEKLN